MLRYRADVFNRGYGGYTSALGLTMVEDLPPPPSNVPANTLPVLVTIFFGANDASAPGYHMVILPNDSIPELFSCGIAKSVVLAI
jgi:hypothetical protein